MALFPFILVNPKKKFGPVLLNHERIHLRQELELLIIPFYIIYLAELVTKGYRNISFEREAYDNEHNLNYLKERKAYSWVKYWRKKANDGER
jgi:hypothetical protein